MEKKTLSPQAIAAFRYQFQFGLDVSNLAFSGYPHQNIFNQSRRCGIPGRTNYEFPTFANAERCTLSRDIYL